MERGETIVHRMTVAFPLQLEKNSKALRFEVGVVVYETPTRPGYWELSDV